MGFKKRIFMLIAIAALFLLANSVKALDENKPTGGGILETTTRNPTTEPNVGIVTGNPNFELPEVSARAWPGDSYYTDPSTITITTPPESVTDPNKEDYNPDDFYVYNPNEKPAVAEQRTDWGTLPENCAQNNEGRTLCNNSDGSVAVVSVQGTAAVNSGPAKENPISSALPGEKTLISDNNPVEEKTVSVSILPENAKQIVEDSLGASQVKKVELDFIEQKPVYKIQSSKQTMLFGFIPIQMQINTQINAQNGEIEKIEKPWWSIFTGG
ncbi:MAG TPA: hypothetical protein VI977_04800 [archaeon]|nr:hypothetical protein [archaeon]